MSNSRNSAFSRRASTSCCLFGSGTNQRLRAFPNKQQDVEARREKALLREFDIYRAHQGKKMKEIRLEVMRVGFKAAWAAKDYRTIIDVSAKVPDEVWQEDERLMMLHSMAETRLEAER